VKGEFQHWQNTWCVLGGTFLAESMLEDRRTGLISYVESPVCSRWVARISANQEELKVEETNEVGIKVKSMNNKERHD
jgi:hypothetical protein